MKRLLTLFTLLLLFTPAWSAREHPQELFSPDGRICVTFDNFRYSVSADGVRVLAPSSISMLVSDGSLYGPGAKFHKVLRRSAGRTIRPEIYKRAVIYDCYNEMELVYKEFSIIFRAYDEGVAYRFVSASKKGFNVVSEKAEFSFPENWMAYVPYLNSTRKNLEEQLCCSFESTYSHLRLKQWERGRGASLPLVVEEPGGMKIAITEADLFDYPGLNLCNNDGSLTLTGYHARVPRSTVRGGERMLQGIVHSREPFVAVSCRSGAVFPWRVIQIARRDTELADSDLVYKLSQEPAYSGWNWVKPGKALWDRWSDRTLLGVEFESGINNETYRHYIDFASEHAIEYVIIDEGWAADNGGDLFNPIPGLDIRDLAQYAIRRGVGIILWAGAWSLDRDMEAIFSHYSAMGIRGFKVDHLNRDDQDMVNFQTRCAQYGAKYGMIIDFHGAGKPTGLHRTFPNVVSFEAVRGQEYMKHTDDLDQVEYDVTMPFARMMAGPVDYTPGAMRNASKESYHPSGGEPMSQGTRCRQIAEYIVFDSPLATLCDSPSNYMAESECTGFIAGIPTIWDETLALEGKMGSHIVTVRRRGYEWYIGALTDWTPREIEIELSFLPPGRYDAVIFRDGKNAAKAARDYLREEKRLDGGGKITLNLAPGGGWAARLTKVL